jgi:hypothetical protein
LAAPLEAATAMTLAWDPSASATGYKVLYGTTSGARTGSYTSQVDVGNVTQATISGLAYNTTYFFAVQAYDAAGLLSSNSSEVAALTPMAPIVPVANKGFAGTGKPSLLWQLGGSITSWFLNGVIGAGHAVTPGGVTDTTWKIAGSADFNNDGYPDLLFQNTATGGLALWYMSGTTMTSATLLSPYGPSDPNWKVAGLGDFDGDGRPDILFQHAMTSQLAVWYMNGTTMTRAMMVNPTGPVDPAWKVAAVVDFNNDGNVDLLFQNATTGALVIWYMTGAHMVSATLLTPMGPSDPHWKVVGVADLNADGKQDLIFQHSLTGQVVAWYMNGSTMTSGAYISTVNSAWKIAAIK